MGAYCNTVPRWYSTVAVRSEDLTYVDILLRRVLSVARGREVELPGHEPDCPVPQPVRDAHAHSNTIESIIGLIIDAGVNN